jgi:hypothetical protein
MPTDIVLAFVRKSQADAQASEDQQAFLLIFCLWAFFASVLTTLIVVGGFNPLIVLEILAAGG